MDKLGIEKCVVGNVKSCSTTRNVVGTGFPDFLISPKQNGQN